MKMSRLIDPWVKSIKQHPSERWLVRDSNYNAVSKKSHWKREERKRNCFLNIYCVVTHIRVLEGLSLHD